MTVVSYYDFLQKTRPDAQQGPLIAAFARPGGPGAKFKVHLEKLYKCLTLPKGAKEELGIAGDEGLTYDEEDEARAKQ